MLDSNEKQIIEDLKKVFQGLDLPILLVGASARLIVFDSRYNIQGRSTKDIDIAVPIEEWTTYDQIINGLTQGEKACFKLTNIEHRLTHLKTQMSVDIVPFGPIGEPDQEIEWRGSEMSMDVTGFSEALENAEIIEELDIKVVSIPALIGLKLLAYNERQSRTKKDLDDIDLILNNYKNSKGIESNQNLIDKFLKEEIGYTDADIYLLGQEISQVFRQETLNKINDVLDELLLNLDDEFDIELEKKRLKILQEGIYQL